MKIVLGEAKEEYDTDVQMAVHFLVLTTSLTSWSFIANTGSDTLRTIRILM